MDDRTNGRDPALAIVIVDDEEPARLLLRELLAAHPDVRVVAECANGFEAVKAVAETSPDLLLLDVQMPKLDGFEVLELLERDVPVVFTTAHDRFALQAFEVHAVDYLLKPISPERLGEALDRVRARIAKGGPGGAAAVVRAARSRSLPLARILVRDGPHVHVIPATAVDYIQGQDDYVSIHAGGREHLKAQTLSDLEAALDPGRFVRVHRSYLLNVDRLRRIEKTGTDGREAVLADGTRLPVSRAGFARLETLL